MPVTVVTYVRDGIVLASDSRITASANAAENSQQTEKGSLFISDFSNFVFLTANNIGLAVCDKVNLNGMPAASLVQAFIKDQCANGQVTIDDMPAKILDYCQQLKPVPEAQFFVAGYKDRRDQQIWRINVANKECVRVNPPNQQGVSFSGEADLILRLLQPIGELDAQGKLLRPLPHFPVAVTVFTLQDAIDFSIFLVRTQIEAVRFCARVKSVGGPIDVLVIQPDQATWVQKKELRGA